MWAKFNEITMDKNKIGSIQRSSIAVDKYLKKIDNYKLLDLKKSVKKKQFEKINMLLERLYRCL